MCKNFIEIKNNKVINSKGKYKKGRWVICDECGIQKISKKEESEYNKRSGK